MLLPSTRSVLDGAAATCSAQVSLERAPQREMADGAGVLENDVGPLCPPERSYYMYVVECADGSLYTGYATDVPRRVAQHNAGEGAKYTRSRRPVRLVASARFATQHEALAAEYRFKRIPRERKLSLIERAHGEARADGDSLEYAFAQVLDAEFPLGAGRSAQRLENLTEDARGDAAGDSDDDSAA